MNTTEHKTITPLNRETNKYFREGGRQVAILFTENEDGEMVYTFSRPEINKENIDILDYLEE